MKSDKYANNLLILHKYWLWSNTMRMKFYEQMDQLDEIKEFQKFIVSEVGVFMMYWYSSLYVVIEEYQKLNMQDEVIDSLCKDVEKINLLRLFRNSTFHVQDSYYSEKYIDFIATKNTAEWVSNLSCNLGKFLLREMKLIKK
jgi:hypothetical protein